MAEDTQITAPAATQVRNVTAAPAGRTRLTAHALVLGERIDTLGLERSDLINTVPLAFRIGEGYAVLFRYGVAALMGLSPVEEDETCAACVRASSVRSTGWKTNPPPSKSCPTRTTRSNPAAISR